MPRRFRRSSEVAKEVSNSIDSEIERSSFVCERSLTIRNQPLDIIDKPSAIIVRQRGTKGQGSLDRDDEDVYFDDESAEVVLSSLRLGGDQDSSLFTNSNWFALEDNRMNNERSTSELASSSPVGNEAVGDDVNKDEDELDTATSPVVPETNPELQPKAEISSSDAKLKDDSGETDDKPAEWVEWRETTTSTSGVSEADKPPLPNGACEEQSESPVVDSKTEPSSPGPDESTDQQQSTDKGNLSTETSLEAELQKQD